MNLMYYIFVSFLILFTPCLFGQTTFNLEANQSMLMYGKGKGQDGATNPFAGKDCYALIKNKGKKEMYIRVQQNGLIIKSIPLLPKETKKVDLPVGYELYFDGNESYSSKVELEFGLN